MFQTPLEKKRIFHLATIFEKTGIMLSHLLNLETLDVLLISRVVYRIFLHV